MKIEQKTCLRALGFGLEVAIVEDCRCPFCADRVDEDEFRNEVFMKEFESSGLCQGCQDTVFGYKVACDRSVAKLKHWISLLMIGDTHGGFRFTSDFFFVGISQIFFANFSI